MCIFVFVVFNVLTGRGEILVHDVGTIEEDGKQNSSANSHSWDWV